VSIYLTVKETFFLKTIQRKQTVSKIHVTDILSLYVQSPYSVYSRLPISHAWIIWLQNYLCKAFFHINSGNYELTFHHLSVSRLTLHRLCSVSMLGEVVCSNRTVYRISWYSADTSACKFMCQTSQPRASYWQYVAP